MTRESTRGEPRGEERKRGKDKREHEGRAERRENEERTRESTRGEPRGEERKRGKDKREHEGRAKGRGEKTRKGQERARGESREERRENEERTRESTRGEPRGEERKRETGQERAQRSTYGLLEVAGAWAAHRVPPRRLEPGRLPRPIVAKLLHYRDRDLLLQKAHEAGPFQVEGGRATLFPDFAVAVQSQQATFLGVKRALREEGLRYSLLFPSKLKIILDGTTHFFQEPDEAWAWLESYRTGTMGTKHMECKPSQRRGKRRHP
ncbi:hypothetical protein NDU88_005448 [Pleurodeles waltl]|uniref:Uncharacterized protein n=1 Tax=Pleurodeles waltl TaxID=8319 RepID=A0AAV7QES1_PLEWA|nr:hypothetical protein NDU88_005448 [Pleurodeles waltl]